MKAYQPGLLIKALDLLLVEITNKVRINRFNNILKKSQKRKEMLKRVP